MAAFDLWQDLERALGASATLPEDLRARLFELANTINLLADSRLPHASAAAEAAKLAGLTGLEIEAHRLARRARAYGELYAMEQRQRDDKKRSLGDLGRLLAAKKPRNAEHKRRLEKFKRALAKEKARNVGWFTGERKAKQAAAALGRMAGVGGRHIQRWGRSCRKRDFGRYLELTQIAPETCC